MEAITIDPPAVATSTRTELDLMSESIQVRADGVDWGDAAIEQALADGERGSTALGYRVPNRTITIPLRVQRGPGVTFEQARNNLQQKVGLLQREGGWVKRQMKATPLYADVINATLKMSGDWLQAHGDIDYNAELTLECLPDFYGAEIDAGTSFSWNNIKGNYPARVRFEMTNATAANWKSVVWAIRNRYYSALSSAAMSYSASSLTLLDAATRTTVTGAVSSPNVIQHADLADDWTPVASTDVSGVMDQHQGVYRAYARVRSTSAAGSVRVRFGYDVGDLTSPTFNDPVTIPISGSWILLDLGEVRLDKVPVGTHRWGGQVQAIGDGLTVQLDQLYFFALDEYMGIAQTNDSTNTLTGFNIRDPFNQTAGALNGKNLSVPSAQTWATSGSAAGDFAVETTGKTAQRSATDPAGVDTTSNGRFAVAGSTNFTDVTVQTDVKFDAVASSTVPEQLYGILARYVDANNWLGFFIVPGTGTVYLRMALAGVFDSTIINTYKFAATDPNFQYSPWLRLTNTWYRLKMDVSKAGLVRCWWGLKAYGLADTPNITWQHSALATGGALATGKPGLQDIRVSGAATVRKYDNFLVKSPTADAACYAGRILQVTSDGMYRQDAAGGAYGPVAKQYGDLPRLPVSGLEGRTTELIVRPSAGDFTSQADAVGNDQPTLRTYYRPCYLYVPED